MVIDCDSCVMRERSCGDCVVTLLLGPINGSIEQHRATFDVLADSGLVPPLRLVVSPNVIGESTQQVS